MNKRELKAELDAAIARINELDSRLDNYQSMARYRWERLMGEQPYPGGPLAAYDVMLSTALAKKEPLP